MTPKLKIASLAAAALALTACASAPFGSTWRAPEARSFAIAGQKMAALYASDVEATRRNAEEAMAGEINARGGKGIAAYTLLDSESGQDRAAVFEMLRQAGVEKALVMRAAARERDAFRPYPWVGSRFGSHWGSYGWGWGVVYDPAYGYPETVVSIETRLYDVAADRLMWASVSQSRNPSDGVELVRRLAGEALRQMEKDGLIY
ncbi:MAG: hypothetical protein MUD16_04150 [Desulfobacterales bacterium]|jgi:hypothetical protein|nr:hypothetical protein [Desulfobacterales bacterium]